MERSGVQSSLAAPVFLAFPKHLEILICIVEHNYTHMSGKILAMFVLHPFQNRIIALEQTESVA